MNRPWWSEDNKVDFESDGLRCAMRRGPLGHWCGYVAIPRDHPWFGKGYSEEVKPSPDMLEKRDKDDHGAIDLLCMALSGSDPSEKLSISLCMRVHGGLTYAGDCVPCEASSAELWWFGFDCAHAGDLTPSLAERYPRTGEVYRDQQYVVAETQNLAAQLAKAGRA